MRPRRRSKKMYFHKLTFCIILMGTANHEETARKENKKDMFIGYSHTFFNEKYLVNLHFHSLWLHSIKILSHRSCSSYSWILLLLGNDVDKNP